MNGILNCPPGVDKDGWLAGARQVPSPNQDARPAGAAIELIVLHNISLPPGEFGGPWIERFFTNRLPADAHPYFAKICDLAVSSHLLIRRDGEVVQFVPFLRRAWHAGRSCWGAREECNDFSIGIEIEGTDDTPYTGVQYDMLAIVIGALRAAYPGIAPDALAGHADVAPGRKTDPGPAFDWQRLHRMLAG